MKESEKTIVRIGMVNYLNTAPIYEKWKDTVHNENWQIIEAFPTTLNKKLADGEIDLGFVSSIEYGRHPAQYKILSGLSVSAGGSVWFRFPVFPCADEPAQWSTGSVQRPVGDLRQSGEDYSGGVSGRAADLFDR